MEQQLVVKTGCLWRGKPWADAIRLSLETADCGIEPVWKFTNPSVVFDTARHISHYQIFGYGNRCKKHVTRIPKALEAYAKGLLDAKLLADKGVDNKNNVVDWKRFECETRDYTAKFYPNMENKVLGYTLTFNGGGVGYIILDVESGYLTPLDVDDLTVEQVGQVLAFIDEVNKNIDLGGV